MTHLTRWDNMSRFKVPACITILGHSIRVFNQGRNAETPLFYPQNNQIFLIQYDA